MVENFDQLNALSSTKFVQTSKNNFFKKLEKWHLESKS